MIVTYSDVEWGYEGEGNIDYYPRFVDPANGDFHLGIGSRCIDAGNNAALYLPEFDFEGDARILDGDEDGIGIVDMGVDEAITGGGLVIQVTIDIKPSTLQNNIRLTSKGTIPVAILTTLQVEAYNINPESVLFAGAEAVRWGLDDVDQDGDLDLVLYFKIPELLLDENSTEVT